MLMIKKKAQKELFTFSLTVYKYLDKGSVPRKELSPEITTENMG